MGVPKSGGAFLWCFCGGNVAVGVPSLVLINHDPVWLRFSTFFNFIFGEWSGHSSSKASDKISTQLTRIVRAQPMTPVKNITSRTWAAKRITLSSIRFKAAIVTTAKNDEQLAAALRHG